MKGVNVSRIEVDTFKNGSHGNFVNRTINDSIDTYDAEGALQFTVAVVVVYGVAVMGVFVMGYFGRRNREFLEMDNQASHFLQNLEQVRVKLEREKHVSDVKTVLKSCSKSSEGDGNAVVSVEEVTSVMPLLNSSIDTQRNSCNGYHCKRAASSGESNLSPLHERPEDDDDDSVFMTEAERDKYGVDFYINLKESDIF